MCEMCSIAELTQVRGEVQRICVGRKIHHPVFLSSLFSFWQSMHSCSQECTHVCVFISSVSSETNKLNLFWDCCYFQNLIKVHILLRLSFSGPSQYTIFGPPLSILYMTTYFSANLLLFILLLFRVRLRHFLGRALWLGQARGPSAAASTGQGAGHYSHMVSYIHVSHI